MPRTARALPVILAILLTACAAAGGSPTIELPGDRVFPEGIAVDSRSGAFYVGSTDDGAIYRGNAADPEAPVEVFAPPGADGRTAVTGMKVDGDGRLIVAGRDTGRIFVYDTASGRLIERFDTVRGGSERSLVNDVALTADAAYVTDSFRPVLYRLPLADAAVGEPEEWLRFDDGPLRYGDGFNLNGIVASEDGRWLVAVQYNTGDLFRIEVETREVVRIDLGGDSLANGDGLLLEGSTLYVVRAAPEQEILLVRLDLAAATGEVFDRIRDDAFDDPTTLATWQDEFLVVNSQLGMAGGGPGEPPFTVALVDRPRPR